AAYRAKGFDARASSDCRNAATAEEAYFVDQATYSSDESALPGFVQSADVDVNITTADATQFVVECSSTKGTTGYKCTWKSKPGAGEANMVCGSRVLARSWTRRRSRHRA